MEMTRITNNMEGNIYNTDYDNIRHLQNINGFPIKINKFNANDYYENVDNFSSRIKEIHNKNLVLNEAERDQEYEVIDSPIDNKLDVEVNNNNKDYGFKKKGSNETVDINFLVDNLNRIEKKNSTLNNFDNAFIHRKFDSLHAFYIESIRLMSIIYLLFYLFTFCKNYLYACSLYLKINYI